MKAKQRRLNIQQRRRRLRVRNRLKRDSTRPRLSVFRSAKHIYAQVIDDEAGRTLAAASSLEKEVRGDLPHGGNIAAARRVGEEIARRALKAGVSRVVFDRREYRYHGRIAALADAARDGGLDLGAKKEQPQEQQPAPPKTAKAKKPAGGKQKASK